MPNIKLESSDGRVFTVDLEVARRSIMIKTMLDLTFKDTEKDEPIPLHKVHGVILEKVLEYANYHKDDNDDQDEFECFEDVHKWKLKDICEWDQKFLQVTLIFGSNGKMRMCFTLGKIYSK